MRVAANAEEYAAPRLNIFFPGVIPELDGQCVSLVKWFMQEMSDVPNPQAARGDARYVGQTLVRQGLADVVPYDQRRRGDIAVFEYGTYGHIGVLLDSDRIFEQNVNVGGVLSKIVDGSRVYASRIGRLSESWRPVRATIYRLRSYTEGTMDRTLTTHEARMIYLEYGYDVAGNDPALQNRKELELRTGIAGMVNNERSNLQNQITGLTNKANGLEVELEAERKGYDLQISNLNGQVADLTAQVTDLTGKVDNLVKVNNVKDTEITRLTKENESLRSQVGDNSKWETFKALIRELFNFNK